MADNRDRRAYYLANKEKINARNRAYRLANPEKVKVARAEYWKSYSKKLKESRPAKETKEYKQSAARRATVRKYRNKRQIIDPSFKIRMQQKNRINSALKRQKSRKAIKTLELLGCSKDELREHIESMWLPGMSWENHKVDGWHIDHIRPCASFDLTIPEQQVACFHYTNLQPLWAKDNLSKSDKVG